MTGIVLDKSNRLGIIEDSYYSKQLNERVYKVRYYDEQKKVNLNSYTFLSEKDLRTTTIQSKLDWKECTIAITLDGMFRASIPFNNQIICCSAHNDIEAFDQLYDLIQILIGE